MAQSSYQIGVLPSVNVNKKLANDWKLNFKTESRQELKSGFFNDTNSFEYEYLLTDVSIMAAKKVGINKTLAAGYLMRLEGSKLINRTMQQFIITSDYTGFRLTHRIASDQTIEKDESNEFRLRYRLSSSIPINGLSIDAKEFYLKINNEYLNSWQDNDHDLEIRIAPYLGYVFTNTSKIELGLDYRLSAFLNDLTKNKFWVALNWYISI